MSKHELIFWAIFLPLNFSFFLLDYILNFKAYPIPGSFLWTKGRTFYQKFTALYLRYESDFFRFNLDLIVLLFLFILIGETNDFWLWLILLYILWSYVYFIYNSIILRIFDRAPSIKSDLKFLQVGLEISYKYRIYLFIATIFLLAFLALVAFFTTSFLLDAAENIPVVGSNTLILLLLLSIVGFYKIIRYPIDKYHFRTVLSPIIGMIKNYNYSNRYQFLVSKSPGYFENKNLYRKYQIPQKPNLIILDIEAYGSILYKDERFASHFTDIYQSFAQSILKNNWHVMSNLSEPPAFAGGSWLSYASLLYGTLINDDLQYNLLFQYSDGFNHYDSILHTLNKNGYQNFLLCPLGGYDDKVDWEIIKKVFVTERLFDYQKLDYEGQNLTFMKFGIMPPDQYSLNKAYSEILGEDFAPYCLFFSTLNSHFFWHTPTQIENNWRNLNSKDYQFPQTDSFQKSYLSKYRSAIEYQLSFIKDFLLKRNPENTNIILVGDHQPAFITEKAMGKETPIHIISKNKDFLKGFEKYGFEEGMLVNDLENNNIKHQGFYSMFMREFLKHYGEKGIVLPPYLPDGVELK